MDETNGRFNMHANILLSIIQLHYVQIVRSKYKFYTLFSVWGVRKNVWLHNLSIWIPAT